MPILGAIRWDGWYYSPDPVSINPGIESARIMSTPEFSGRAPVWGYLTQTTTMNWGDSQTTFDAEITAANTAGLGFWNYLMYRNDHLPAMNIAWNYHQSSPIKNLMNWTAMISPNWLGTFANHATEVANMISYLLQPNYQMVLGNRPLMFIYDPANISPTQFGSLANFKTVIDEIRSGVILGGRGDPYIVLQNPNFSTVTSLGLQGIFDYAVANSGTADRSPYVNLSNYIKNSLWPARVASGYKYIPIAMMGWDNRPYLQRPYGSFRYNGNYHPYVRLSRTYQTATPVEIVNHVQDAFDFIGANPSVCDADVVCAYAWDECSEGGWLVPTRDGSGQARLNALQAIL